MKPALRLVQSQDREVRVLPSAKAYFSHHKNRQWIRDTAPLGTLTRIDNLLSVCSTCDLDFDINDLASLNVRGIDEGERIFFAVTDTNCRMATGDANCLRALAREARRNQTRIASIHARWQGRVVWLDQVLHELCRQEPGRVAEKLWPASACDSALLGSFATGGKAPTADVMASLERRVATLRRDSNDLLLTAFS